MKTTVELPDALYHDVRTWAAEHGWTIKVVLEQSLREFLDKQAARGQSIPPTWRPVVFGGQGLQTPGMTFREMLDMADRPVPNQQAAK